MESYVDTFKPPAATTLSVVEDILNYCNAYGSATYDLSGGITFTVEADSPWELAEKVYDIKHEIDSYGFDYEVSQENIVK